MKKSLFTFILIVTTTGIFAQVQVVDNFGNKKISQGGTEPWRIQGATTVATANDQNIYQTGNVGIGDFAATTATQKLDVNGNARVRTLADGSNTTNFPNMVVAQADGTLGAANISASGVTPNDNATTMFVIRRYTVGDSPNFNTNMSTAKWEAIMSNIRYTWSSNTGSQFPPNGAFGYRLATAGGNWMITGDIFNVFETNVIVDVLFIKKGIVAADTRN